MATIEVGKVPDGTKLTPMANHQRVVLSHVAVFTMDLLKMAMIQPCVPDGEDTAGNRQYRMMTVEEAVGRATEIAELSFATFSGRGWTAPTPSLDELIEGKTPVGFHRQRDAEQEQGAKL